MDGVETGLWDGCVNAVVGWICGDKIGVLDVDAEYKQNLFHYRCHIDSIERLLRFFLHEYSVLLQ